MNLSIAKLRDVIHCIYTCGPDGSTDDCAAMGVNPCDACSVLEELKEPDLRIGIDYTAQYKRANEQLKAEEKARGQAQFEAAPVYTGTNVKSCQACKFPPRGAPYRCGKKGVLRMVRVARNGNGAWAGQVMVVCAGCAHKTHVGPYTGWGGDPNPKIERAEPELAALVPELVP